MAIQTSSAVDAATLAKYDAIIDVRSPGEFAEDHLPGAENLPVLNNEERAEVGTIYVQQSRFLARRIGAAHVARNIARHLEAALSDRPSGFKPLIYCWRGGQRSNAMATILDQVGWPVTLLTGGYKTYRRAVQIRLYDEVPTLKVILLDGHTGSAKTDILNRLAGHGVQTLDLEGLAHHRGSLFGAMAGKPQPSQKMFESRLLAAVDALDPSRQVVVEAESSKIGERMVPPTIWKAMLTAPTIELSVPLRERARYLVSAYHDIIDDQARLEETLERLPGRHGRKRLTEWLELARSGSFEALAEDLMRDHYDPAYQRSRREDNHRSLGVIDVDDLSAGGQKSAADAIARLVEMETAR